MKKSNTSRRTAALAAAGVLTMANIAETDIPLQLDRGDNVPGTICVANESRFVEAYFSEPLTAYAVGWRDPGDLDGLLEFMAPQVPTSRRFQFAKASNAEEFISESTDDVRAISGDFKRVEYTSEKVDSSTQNKGLTIRVDLDQVAEMPNWQQTYTAKLMRRLLRAECRRAYALLIAAATDTGKVWGSSFTGKDPDQDVATAVIAYADAVGINPARILFGTQAWNLRRLCHRALNVAGSFASAGMSVDEVARAAGAMEGRVSTERYTATASTKAKIVGDKVILFHAEAGQTPEDASNIKRFVSNADGGTRFRVFAQQVNAKLFDITVEHYSRIVVTSTLGIQTLSIT